VKGAGQNSPKRFKKGTGARAEGCRSTLKGSRKTLTRRPLGSVGIGGNPVRTIKEDVSYYLFGGRKTVESRPKKNIALDFGPSPAFRRGVERRGGGLASVKGLVVVAGGRRSAKYQEGKKKKYSKKRFLRTRKGRRLDAPKMHRQQP